MACRLYADGTKAFTPAEIIGNMWRFTDLDASRQEDSHEFLSGVVQSFCAETMADDCDAGGRSFAQNLFEGRQLSRATCACGYYGDGRLESFHALSLPMEKDLNASLAAYTSHEELSDYRCERCDSCVKASRRLTIHDAPHILTLQLQRFAYTKRRELTKITKALEYPETLDLAPYMSEGRAGPVYRLCGIICHRSKRATDGHYVAWVKSSEGRWFEMNDEAVKEISEGQAFLSAKEDAYVLLYARVGDDERGEDAAEHAVEAVKREVETVEEVAEWSVVGGRKAKKAQKEVLRMQKRKMGETGNASE
ncbi:hypothetical protein BD626DRAFT_412132 [Schizophyllum amplum]|uniref:USP domain-containing protein n=1 Tax=Schizophyllum amplum TaxID=97359 RepID=A0A550BY05_9AGAR|nr:hypothetical protein BD626DRAFT_412132 [Auriculariopsis ampla]